jgi:hypothetical protein
MARQHDRSCDCIKSEVDLFGVPPTQTSIESGGWDNIHPIATLSDTAPIEFSVPGDGEQYFDLNNVLLYLKVRIVNGDGTVLADDANVGPVNNFMHSLFERVDVILGDTVVTSSSDMYPYRALLEALLSYSEDAKKSQLTTTLFEKDTAGKMDAYLTGQGADRNVGLVKRAKFTSQSKPLEMLGKLSCDIFSQDRLLLNKVPFRIRLIRSKDAFSLMTGANNADYKVNIQSAILMVRRVEVSPSIFIGHQNALRHGPAKYPIKRVVCKYFSIPQGNTSTNQENLFQGQMPTRIIVGLVDAAASNGHYKKNPFNFQHKNLTHVALRVGGLKEPIKPITPSFPNQSLLSYVSLLIGTGKFGRDEGCGFARDEHANGYCLHAWDLTADLSDGDTFQLMKNTSVRLELKFSEPLDTPTNVIVYAEFENLILIDADRNITTNYVN